MGYYQFSLKEINSCLQNNPNEFHAILFKANLLNLFGMFEECIQIFINNNSNKIIFNKIFYFKITLKILFYLKLNNIFKGALIV
jgi:hypothetical protein